MKKVLQVLVIVALASVAKAQNVGIGTATPNQSAALEIKSDSQGFLPPRMTLAQRNGIKSPEPGLQIWCTDCDELQVFNGVIWKNGGGAAACQVAPATPLPGVTICNQIWMVKNLNVSHYRNGDPILNVTTDLDWSGLATGAWCWYKNDSATYSGYGKIYNWYAVNDPRGLAPAGWHIPSDSEWTNLINCLGVLSTVGYKMKEPGLTHWLTTNPLVSNSSGFTGLPAGRRNQIDGSFNSVGIYGLWWTATEFSVGNSWSYALFDENGQLYKSSVGKRTGYSVRCVRD